MLLLASCGDEEPNETVFYLPVWDECFNEFKEFHQNDKYAQVEYHPFPQSEYNHPRLLGVMKIVLSYKNATQNYPSVNCLADHRTTNNYSSPVSLRVIEDMMDKIQSDSKPNLAYMVFDKKSYSIYWSERE